MSHKRMAMPIGIVFLGMLSLGCERKSADPAAIKQEIHQFCREQDSEDVAKTLTGIYSRGLCHSGVLNGNGINCFRVLFTNVGCL